MKPDPLPCSISGCWRNRGKKRSMPGGNSLLGGVLGPLRADIHHARLDVLGHGGEGLTQVLERPRGGNGRGRHRRDGGRRPGLLLRRRAVGQVEQAGEQQPQREGQGHQAAEFEPVQ